MHRQCLSISSSHKRLCIGFEIVGGTWIQIRNKRSIRAITELTAHLSRRSLYCSKHANGKYSVSHFDDEAGNIQYHALRHTWEAGKCKYCGASQAVYDRSDAAEQYAYQFIHTDNPNTLFNNMKFDVIIGNPPYQLSDGGAQASATPLYDQFVEQAKKLNPRYLCMIIPSRWYAGGKGLDGFRNRMISDKNIRILHDFLNASDCFGTGVEIKGGVCYFLWDRDNEGYCAIFTHNGSEIKQQKARYLKEGGSSVFIRYEEGVSILKKVQAHKEPTIESLVSVQKPFGLRTFTHGQAKPFADSIALFERGGVGYITSEDIEKNTESVDKHKIYISRAYNAGDTYPHQIIGKPIYGPPGSCCTETYVMVGPFGSKEITENVIKYICTKFFRFLVFLIKVSQMAPSTVYAFVPLQDFSHPWTDEMLFKKYGLTEEEIAFIESMIRPME